MMNLKGLSLDINGKSAHPAIKWRAFSDEYHEAVCVAGGKSLIEKKDN